MAKSVKERIPISPTPYSMFLQNFIQKVNALPLIFIHGVFHDMFLSKQTVQNRAFFRFDFLYQTQECVASAFQRSFWWVCIWNTNCFKRNVYIILSCKSGVTKFQLDINRYFDIFGETRINVIEQIKQ